MFCALQLRPMPLQIRQALPVSRQSKLARDNRAKHFVSLGEVGEDCLQAELGRLAVNPNL